MTAPVKKKQTEQMSGKKYHLNIMRQLTWICKAKSSVNLTNFTGTALWFVDRKEVTCHFFILVRLLTYQILICKQGIMV